jgi:hypothetical protein
MCQLMTVAAWFVSGAPTRVPTVVTDAVPDALVADVRSTTSQPVVSALETDRREMKDVL